MVNLGTSLSHLSFSNCAGWKSLGGERNLVNQDFLKKFISNAPKWWLKLQKIKILSPSIRTEGLVPETLAGTKLMGV